jgi:hypothetical protein
MVLFAMTSCAQLPPSDQVISAMRCPAHPETQFLDPEKFDLGSLASGGCDKRRTTALLARHVVAGAKQRRTI